VLLCVREAFVLRMWKRLGYSVCGGLLRGRGAGVLRGGLGIVCLHGGGRRMPFMRGGGRGGGGWVW
jgi:hypothetical protein